jgi:hypothetical protein
LTIWQDLRFAVRTFVTTPGFNIVLLTLAPGIGANSAFRQTSFFEPQQLIGILSQITDAALKPGRAHNGCSECVLGILRCGHTGSYDEKQ